MAPDLDKIQAIVAWPTPSLQFELRGFLGLTGFYRKFIAKKGPIFLAIGSPTSLQSSQTMYD